MSQAIPNISVPLAPTPPSPISAGRALFYAIIAALPIGLVLSIAIAASTRWAAAGQFGALALSKLLSFVLLWHGIWLYHRFSNGAWRPRDGHEQVHDMTVAYAFFKTLLVWVTFDLLLPWLLSDQFQSAQWLPWLLGVLAVAKFIVIALNVGAVHFYIALFPLLWLMLLLNLRFATVLGFVALAVLWLPQRQQPFLMSIEPLEGGATAVLLIKALQLWCVTVGLAMLGWAARGKDGVQRHLP
jgi:hypothetical protein